MVDRLHTGRLLLRRIGILDLPRLAELYQDPEVMHFVGRRTRTVDESRLFLQRMIDHWTAHGFGFFAVFDRVEGEQGPLLGRVGLGYLENTGQVELGYLFGRAHWSRGYGTECARRLLRWGFEELRLPRVVAIAEPENLASLRVMQKAGMVADGFAHHYGFRVARYALSAEQWRSVSAVR